MAYEFQCNCKNRIFVVCNQFLSIVYIFRAFSSCEAVVAFSTQKEQQQKTLTFSLNHKNKTKTMNPRKYKKK